MGKVLIIGAGGVGSVVTQKCAQVPEVFSEITLASRTLEKCKKVAGLLPRAIRTSIVDADNTEQTAALIREVSPDLVINVALPYQDLSIIVTMPFRSLPMIASSDESTMAANRDRASSARLRSVMSR